MKKRQICGAVLCAALLMTALPGTDQTARADGEDGPIEEILLVNSQEDASLREVFRICSEEGEKSEKIEEEALKELKETSDTAVLIIGRMPQEETDAAKEDNASALPQKEQEGAAGEPLLEELPVEGETVLSEETEPESEDRQDKQVAITESQQQMIGQVAAEFDNVVVLFNNFRPYGLEVLDQYASIKSITMIETQEEKQVRKAARQLVRLVAPQEEQQEETWQTGQEETAQTEEAQTDPLLKETETVIQTEPESAAPNVQKEAAADTGGQNQAQDQDKGSERPMGDVNGDGKVDSQDASALMGLIGEDVDEQLFPFADVTGDGSINKKDVKELLRYITGEITGFEGEEK